MQTLAKYMAMDVFICILLPIILLALAFLLLVFAARFHHKLKIPLGGIHERALYRHKCPYCTAGKQTLTKGGWGPIPVDHRIVPHPNLDGYLDSDAPYNAPAANVRDCNRCQGMGYQLFRYPPEQVSRTEKEDTDA